MSLADRSGFYFLRFRDGVRKKYGKNKSQEDRNKRIYKETDW